MESTTDIVSTDNKQIARASGTIMFAFVIGQVFSLISGMLILSRFGAGLESDAFTAANKLPDIIYQLIAGGALASAFVPTFTALITRRQTDTAWRLASAIANLISLIFIVIGIVTTIFAPWVVHNILAPDFVDPVKFKLTVDLMRMQMIAPVIFGISGLLMGILNSHQNFLWPALAPALYSVGKILGVIFLAPSMGIYGLVIGVIGGALMHCLIQIPGLLKLPKHKYSLTLGLNMPEVREVLKLMGPRMIGVAFVQLNFLINLRLASGLGDGPMTAITYGFTLMMMPEIAIAQSIAIAALPTFSTQVSNGKLEDMRSSLASLLRGLLFLSIPASLGLIFLRVPIVTLLYQHKNFTPQMTQLIAWALLFYAVGLVGFSLVEIISRAFYALHDTITPVLVLIVTMSINIGLSYMFLYQFKQIGWMPHGGLALSMSLATFLEMLILLYLMRRKLSGLSGKTIVNGLIKALVAGGGMSAALWGWLFLTSTYSAWIVTLGGVAIGILAYIMGLWLLRVPELKMVLQIGSKLMSRFGGGKKGEA